MAQHNQPNNTPLNQEDEISLVDILLFLSRAWKIIAIFGVIGLASAVIYLSMVPKQYEIIAQIRMTQVGAAINNNNINFGINIEEPDSLIARMSLPSSYTTATTDACGFDGKENATSMLAKSIMFSKPKGVTNAVELKTTISHPERAQQCVNAIVDLIKTSQYKIASPYIAEVKNKLVDYQAQLIKAKDFISKADNLGSVGFGAYLANRDEMKYLLDKIILLQDLVSNNTNREAQLVAPIYVSEFPVAPKIQVSLATGLSAGLCWGLLIALLSQAIPKLKKQLANSIDKTLKNSG